MYFQNIMKSTDFVKLLNSFFSTHLSDERGLRENTIRAYADTFTLFVRFLMDKKKLNIQELTIKCITKQIILDFLDWGEKEKKWAPVTRNSRLAAIKTFFDYVARNNSKALLRAQEVDSIFSKKTQKSLPTYLTTDGLKLFFKQPNLGVKEGRRDLTMLTLMYDTAARVQELIDLTPSSLKLRDKSVIVKLVGKGNKSREVILLDPQIDILKKYLKEFELDKPEKSQHPLFFNFWGEKLTRGGILYIVKKYATLARHENNSLIPDKITCHSFRHSKAMHLVQAGVDIIYIADILGHENTSTTGIYARADPKTKKEVLEKAFVSLTDDIPPEPLLSNKNALLKFIESFR